MLNNCDRCGYSLQPTHTLTVGDRRCTCPPFDHGAELGADYYGY